MKNSFFFFQKNLVTFNLIDNWVSYWPSRVIILTILKFYNFNTFRLYLNTLFKYSLQNNNGRHKEEDFRRILLRNSIRIPLL